MRNAVTEVAGRKSLRELIDERGLRYQFVAERIGVTPSHLTRLMDGTRPLTAAVAEKLAELLAVPVEDLLPGGGE